MSRRTAAWFAWSMWATSLALTALSFLLLALNFSHPDVPIYPYWLENILFAVGFSTVGAVIASRSSPKNPIGWLFCAIGLSFGVDHFSASTPSTNFWRNQERLWEVKRQHGSYPGLGY